MTITLRWTLILIGIVVVAGLIGWALNAIELGRMAGKNQAALKESTVQTAENTARAIAVVGNRDIAAGRFETLQQCADNLVRSKPLTFIAIVDRSGRAMVHTDRSRVRKPWKTPEESADRVVVTVPAMDFTEEVAKVYVGARVPRQ